MSPNTRSFAGAAVLLCALWLVGVPALAVPEATISPCAAPPTIDGQLEDACWQAATPFGEFHLKGGQAKATQSTIVKACFDSKWLYLGILCKSSDPKGISPKATQHDGPVHRDESLEIFIDPGTRGASYGDFMLNAINTQAEQYLSGGSRDKSWSPVWRSATKIHETGWNAEAAIPLYVLASLGDLAQMRMNIARNAGAESGEPSTWAPVSGGFHNAAAFGFIKGLADIKPEIPYLAFGNIQVGMYREIAGKFSYDVSLDVGADPNIPRAVRIAVTDKPASGQERTVARDLNILPGKPQNLTIAVPVDDQTRRQTVITMLDTATGKALQSETVTDAPSLSVMSVHLDRSYYTTEQEARAVCSVALPAIALGGLSAVVLDGKGETLGRSSNVLGETCVAFGVGAMPTGAHTLRVELRAADGKPVAVREVVLTKRPPKPGREWKIDHVNRVLLRDGVPFFPYGLILHMPKIDRIEDKEGDFRNASTMGFNTVLQWCSNMDPEIADDYLEMAARYSLNVLGYAGGFFAGIDLEGAGEYLDAESLQVAIKIFKTAWANNVKGNLMLNPILRKLPPETKVRLFEQYYQKNLPRVRAGIDGMKDRTNLIGYKLFDEPPEKSWFAMYVHGRKLYRDIGEMDGYHPAFLLYSSYIPPGEEYVDWADCLGTDPYWCAAGGTPGIRGTVNFVAKITGLTDARAAERRQVTWIVPVGEWYSGSRKRAILPKEQFCQTYLALIHGAKAILYFCHPFQSRMSVDTLTSLADQMRTLGPIAVAPRVPQTIEYVPGVFNPIKDTPENYPFIQVALMRNPAGGYVLLAANSREYPVEVTYRVSLLGRTGTVGRLFSDRTHKVRDGAFSDELESMDTRAYTFEGASALTEPVAIKVEMQALREGSEQETSVPLAGREGKRNRMPNPSFEEASVPGWPDYYICRTPGIGDTYYLGDPGAPFSLDSANPFHGRHSVKINSPFSAGSWVMAKLGPKETTPTKYVMSVYMRAERDGFKVTFFAFNKSQRVVELTTQWQRYVVEGSVPFDDSDTLWGVQTKDVGTFWVDAIQLEKGAEPTEFEP